MKNRSKSAKGILAQPRITMVAALVAACIGTEAHALGFGRMRVQSALGQPLRAEVELIDANSSNLRAGTAPASAYAQKGLEYSSTAKGIRASVRKMPNGRAVLVLTSDAPINEPFVDVVLQASDGSGNVIRDFSLLLDPPATTRAPVNVVEPATPRASTTARTTERMALPPADGAEGERAAAPAGRKRATATRARSRSGAVRVRRGDTAGQIAARNRPARVSLDQMLVALQRANSHAFINGNVNLLKSGVVLKMPSATEARAVSAAEARAIITAQSEDFRNYRSQLARSPMARTTPGAQQSGGQIQSRVEDGRTSPAAAPDTLTISKAEIKTNNVPAPEQRIAEAMQKRDNINRADELNKNLSDLKNISAEAAASAQPGTAPAVVPPTGAATGAASVPASIIAPIDAASAVGEMASAAASAAVAAASDAASAVEQAASEAASAASAAASVPSKKPVTPPPAPVPEEPGFLEGLTQNPLLLGGVGLAALGGLAYLFIRRRRQNQDEAGSSFFESNYAPDSFFDASGGEDVNTSENVTTAGMGATHAGQSSMLYSPSQLDADADVDPVAEADVYLAYGRDVQAEEILKDALLKHPENVAVHAKLLEVYGRRRDVNAYAQAATVFKQLTKGAGAEWETVRVKGAEIDPGNTLYAGSEASNNSAPAIASSAAMGVAGAAVAAAPSITPPVQVAPVAPAQPVTQQSNQEFDLASLSPATVPGATRASQINRDSEPSPALDLSLDMPAAAQPAAAQPEAESVMDHGLEFSMSGLSLDSEQPDPAADTDSTHPLETKLALAREFMGIGDNEGARIMAQEVAQNATGELKAQAEALLASMR